MSETNGIGTFVGIERLGRGIPAQSIVTPQPPAQEAPSYEMGKDARLSPNGRQSSLSSSLEDFDLLELASENLFTAISASNQVSNTIAPATPSPEVPRAGNDAPVQVSDSGSSPQRSVQDVRQGADAVWATHTEWKDLKHRGVVREIKQEFREVNGHVDAKQQAAAQAEIDANAGLEAQALSKLGPADQRAYTELAESMQSNGPARLALQVLLVEGKLPGNSKAADGKNVLEQLSSLQHAPLAPMIDHGSLMAGLVQEIAQPARVNQKASPTCRASSFQMQMAMQQPAELVRQVAGLASSKGEVEMPAGPPVKRALGTEAEDGLGRSISNRLWAPAVLNYGSDNPVDTHAYEDPSYFDAIPRFAKAMGAPEQMAVASGNMIRYIEDPEFRTESRQAIQDLLQSGHPLRAGIAVRNDLGEFGHEVTLIGMDKNGVTFLNSWGTKEHMTELPKGISG